MGVYVPQALWVVNQHDNFLNATFVYLKFNIIWYIEFTVSWYYTMVCDPEMNIYNIYFQKTIFNITLKFILIKFIYYNI